VVGEVSCKNFGFIPKPSGIADGILIGKPLLSSQASKMHYSGGHGFYWLITESEWTRMAVYIG
jgi:hypothetical protein